MKGIEKAMNEKGRRVRIGTKMEKKILAAINISRFYGAVKNGFILQNVDDKR